MPTAEPHTEVALHWSADNRHQRTSESQPRTLFVDSRYLFRRCDVVSNEYLLMHNIVFIWHIFSDSCQGLKNRNVLIFKF